MNPTASSWTFPARARGYAMGLALVALGLFLLLAGTGCAGTLGNHAFIVRTNYAPQVHVIERPITNTITITNVLRELVPVPGSNVAVIVERTNVIAIPQIVTNTITVTNLVPVSVEVAPRPEISKGVDIVAGLTGPWGTLAGVGLTALLGILARHRERKINAMLAQEKAAESTANVVLTESIEVARELLRGTPQGKRLEAQYLNFLRAHQSAAGVADVVAQALKGMDSKAARAAADMLAPKDPAP